MAKATKTTTAVATKKQASTAVAAARPMGRGFEEADAESFAIPFLALLQKGSPMADPDDAAYVKGAKPGMFINTVTHELFTEPEIIPCAYQRRFNRWAPIDSGGGFKGVFQPSMIPKMEGEGQISQNEEGRWFFTLPDGSINEKKCDILTDTRMHYCQQVLDNGTLTGVLVSLSRTQLKKSKQWMTLMSQKGGDMFDYSYTVKSQPEENDKGKWYGWAITLARETEGEERGACEAFYTSVQSGAVKVKMENVDE